jgi:hypothetical protein
MYREMKVATLLDEPTINSGCVISLWTTFETIFEAQFTNNKIIFM